MSLFGRHKVRPNMVPLGAGMYVVRSQAGFNKALKMEFAEELADLGDPDKHPTSYPSVVCLTKGYNGLPYPQVRCLPVNHMKTALLDQ